VRRDETLPALALAFPVLRTKRCLAKGRAVGDKACPVTASTSDLDAGIRRDQQMVYSAPKHRTCYIIQENYFDGRKRS